MSHTPGPWTIDAPHHVDEDDQPLCDGRYHIIDAGPGYLDDENKQGFCLSGIMNDSDARLIAAAPQLLSVLREIYDWADNHEDVDDGIPNDANRVKGMICAHLGDLVDLLLKQAVTR